MGITNDASGVIECVLLSGVPNEAISQIGRGSYQRQSKWGISLAVETGLGRP